MPTNAIAGRSQGGAAAGVRLGSSIAPFKKLTANATLKLNESGTVYLCDAADLVITLPATRAGVVYTFVLGPNGLSTGTGLSISPAAADAIHGNGLTSVDDKDLILAGSGDREGDIVTIVGDGIDGWFITAVTGTWSKEA